MCVHHFGQQRLYIHRYVCNTYVTLLFTHHCKTKDLSDKLALLSSFEYYRHWLCCYAVFMHHRQLMRMLHFMRPAATINHAV